MGLKDDTGAILKKKNRATVLQDGSNALPGDFNADLYLQARPDVQKAIDDGSINSAEEHYMSQGFQEDNSLYNKLKSDTAAALNNKSGSNPIASSQSTPYQDMLRISKEQGLPLPTQSAAPIVTNAPIDYRTKAKALLDSTYNTRVADATNEANLAIQGYDNQKGVVQSNYLDQMKSANTNIGMGKNNAVRRAISSGLLESQNTNANLNSMDLQGNELRNKIDTAKTDSLNNIENMKNVIRQNLQSKLGAMKNDYETSLNAKADELENRDWTRGITEAGITGKYNGQDTLQGKLSNAQLTGINLENDSKVIANYFAPQIQQGLIDKNQLDIGYQRMVNAGFPAVQAAQLAGMLAQNKSVELGNEAQEIALKYAPEIEQGKVDSVKLQNAYQTLVNNGYDKAQAAQIAAVYANIRQGDAQIAISSKNADTSAASLDWAKNPNNPDNKLKQDTARATRINDVISTIDGLYVGTKKNDNGETSKFIPDANKIKIENAILNSGLDSDAMKRLYAYYGIPLPQ